MGIREAFFGQGSGPIFIDDSACAVTEAALIDCTYNSMENCLHSEDASVLCAYSGRSIKNYTVSYT